MWQRTLAQPPACIENKTTIYSIHALFVSIYIHTDNISPKQTFAYGYFICFLIYLILRILLQVFSSNMKISYVDDSHLLEVLCIWLFSLIWLSGFPLKYILLSFDKFARGMYIVNRFSIAYFRTRTLFVTIESSKILEEAWVDHIKYFRLVPIKNGINLCTNLSICQIIKI